MKPRLCRLIRNDERTLRVIVYKEELDKFYYISIQAFYHNMVSQIQSYTTTYSSIIYKKDIKIIEEIDINDNLIMYSKKIINEIFNLEFK